MSQLTAHYFAGRRNNQPVRELIIANGPSIAEPNVVARMDVAGKAEARKIAAQRGAQCWNF